MTLHVNEIEALWVAVTAAGFFLTLLALFDSFRGLRDARNDATPSREARELTARGNVRREFLRLVVMSLLMSLAVPALLSDRPLTLSPVVVALICVPVIMFISTAFDARDRGRLAEILIGIVRVERDALALESSVQEGIALTRIAVERAEAAYDAGNHANEKLARLTEIVGGKEDKDDPA